MAAKLLQKFSGHSGSEVYLLRKSDRVFVRKINNIDRNHDRLIALQEYSVPRLYGRQENILDMEYIHGLDLRTYLINYSSYDLAEFLLSTLQAFAKSCCEKNYSSTYDLFLSQVNFEVLPFSQQQLTQSLPKKLPCSQYHGDLTLENIIWNQRGFVMIDCSSGPWDSWIFDFYKLQQDLKCQWFLRKNPAKIENKLSYINNQLIDKLNIELEPSLIILMLLRVLNHCQPNDADAKFILQHIYQLWK